MNDDIAPFVAVAIIALLLGGIAGGIIASKVSEGLYKAEFIEAGAFKHHAAVYFVTPAPANVDMVNNRPVYVHPATPTKLAPPVPPVNPEMPTQTGK